MTRKFLPSLILCAALLLASCSSIQATAAATQKTLAGETNSSTTGSQDQGLSVLQLAAGMLGLETSDYPVEAAQAATLLPLWKAARSLAQSDTAADVEITALVAQIQAGLTAEQLQYIQGLTTQELSSIAQQYGQSGGAGAAPVAGSAAPAGDPGAMGAPPGGMEGGPPPDGGMPGGGASSSSAQTSTDSTASFEGVSSALLAVVIQTLHAKTP